MMWLVSAGGWCRRGAGPCVGPAEAAGASGVRRSPPRAAAGSSGTRLPTADTQATPQLASSAAELSVVSRPQFACVASLLHKNAEHISSPASVAGVKRALERAPDVIGPAIPPPGEGAYGPGQMRLHGRLSPQ